MLENKKKKIYLYGKYLTTALKGRENRCRPK